MIETNVTDICIIGAGPVGLFAVFEAGLLKMRSHVVDALPQVGGQLAEIYPRKPIYDIPGHPEISGLGLIEKLMQQIAPFKPVFTLGEIVEKIERLEDRSFVVLTSEGRTIRCQVIVIAGGLGCFEPRKPALAGLGAYEGRGVAYMIKDPETYRDKQVLIAGAGDSALDWAIFLADIARSLTLVHRGDTFRGAPDSAEKVFELARAGKIRLLLKCHLKELKGDDHLTGIILQDHLGQEHELAADHLIPLYGLSPKLGPIADWGLAVVQNAIPVSTVDYSTDQERIYAIGDINTYPGKLKLILSGFHEAALMAQSAFKYVHPQEKLSFKYTTVYGIKEFQG